ncbi:hypothetical protein HK101_005145, partial [Irineochytrium annulatum]
ERSLAASRVASPLATPTKEMSLVYHYNRGIPWSDEAAYIFGGGMSVLVVGWSATVYLFWRRRSYQCIAARGASLTLIQASAGIIASVAMVDYRFIYYLPCFVNREFSALLVGVCWLQRLAGQDASEVGPLLAS